jgi:hypothetical protein
MEIGLLIVLIAMRGLQFLCKAICDPHTFAFATFCANFREHVALGADGLVG